MASPATLEALEFPALLALVAELAASDIGRQRLAALEPSVSLGELRRRQERVRDAQRVLEEGILVPSQEEPLLPLLQALRSTEKSLTGGQLMQLAGVLRATRGVSERLRSSEDEVASLDSLLAALPDGEPLRRRIEERLDKRGRVRDDASPALVQLRRRVQRIRDGLYKALQRTAELHEEKLSEATVSLREGRLLLMLKAGARGRLEGLIHGRSGTGQSFYFEPLTTVEANNDLQESIEEEEAERRRILVELVEEAQRELPLVESHFELLGELDMLQAACRFAARTDAHLPGVCEPGDLRIVRARHPLLDPSLAPLREAALGQAGHTETIVPLDVDLDSSRRVLVITGPNAGGKTVALKTVGLLSLSAQCGLPIPAAADTRLPLFAGVMAMVGDEQDLLSDQSTFSARLLRLKEAWEIAGSGTLVLLDEVGSGTDPEEGAALAVALLEGLLETGTLAILTTHTSQLAAAALEREGAGCAAMEFEPSSGRPTYQLRPGAPGGSQALALAERLGLPGPWLDRAEALLGSEHRDLRRLLQEVEGVREELARERSRARAESKKLEIRRRLVDEELSAVKRERKVLAKKARAELEVFRRQVRDRLRDEFEVLRQDFAAGRRRGVVSAGVARLFEGAPSLEQDEEPADGPLIVGGEVRHRSLGWQGKLEKLRGVRAEVVVRGKRVRCSLEDLLPVRENAAGESRRPPEVELTSADSTAPEIPAELDLVGQRVEPALQTLDRYLDRALLSELTHVRVIHGFGSGRLRDAVRRHLQRHPAAAEIRPGKRSEGGDGATVVNLDRD